MSAGSTGTTPVLAPGCLPRSGSNAQPCGGRAGLAEILCSRPVLSLLCPLCKELKESATELLFGGHETTASAATSLIAFLGLHHDVLQKVRKELQVKVCVFPRAIPQEGALGRYLPDRGVPDRAPLNPGGALLLGGGTKTLLTEGWLLCSAGSPGCLHHECHDSLFLSRGYCAVPTKRSSWTWRSWSS